MKDIRQLEREGYEGPDACIAESLFMYGVIWRKSKTTGAYHFYYKHPRFDGRFDTATFEAKEMTFEVFDWASRDELETYMEAIPDEGTPEFLAALSSFYGVEDAFGTSYDYGVYIFDSEQYEGEWDEESVFWMPIGNQDLTCQAIFIEESGVQDGITWFKASIEDTRKSKPVELLGQSPDLDALLTFCSTIVDDLTDLEEQRSDVLYEAVQEMRELGR